jgi:hypothetical protein
MSPGWTNFFLVGLGGFEPPTSSEETHPIFGAAWNQRFSKPGAAFNQPISAYFGLVWVQF